MSRCANRLAASSNSRYVNDIPSKLTATTSGARLTCAVNSSGIDTGTVSSGLVVRASLAYDMWGAAVDLAFSARGGSPRPGVYVTSDVYDAMRDSRQFVAAGEVTAGGRTEPIWRLAEQQS